MAVRTKVNLYYDILSPYAWFAFESLSRYQNLWELDLQLKPSNIKRIMSESGNIPPIGNAYKRDMFSHDTSRVAQIMELPYQDNYSMENLVRGSTLCMKSLVACQILFPEHLNELTRQSWFGNFAQNVDITDRDNLEMFAELANVPDVKGLLKFSLGDEARAQFIANTKEALDSKCFGVPWMTVENPISGQTESLFGFDRIEMLGSIINKEYRGHNPSS